jgi:hypothetical protein
MSCRSHVLSLIAMSCLVAACGGGGGDGGESAGSIGADSKTTADTAVTADTADTSATTLALSRAAGPAGASAPAPMPTAPAWRMVVNEGASFTVPSNSVMRFGNVDAGWVEKAVSGAGSCTNAFFGFDVSKPGFRTCHIKTEKVEAPSSPAWHHVADENGVFNVPAQSVMRFGNAQAGWVERIVSGVGACTNASFGFDVSVPGFRRCYLNVANAAAPAVKVSEGSDRTGKITTAVFERVASTANTKFTDFRVEVPEDYIVVNGGLEVLDVPYGHSVTASYPNDDLSAWMVSSQSILSTRPARVKAWAVGLKLQGLTREQALKYLRREEASGMNAASARAFNNPYIWVGGGFRFDLPSTARSLVFTSTYGQGWDSSILTGVNPAYPVPVRSYTVMLHELIPALGVLVEKTVNGYAPPPRSIYSGAVSGRAISALRAEAVSSIAPFALTGCGVTMPSLTSSMLVKLMPRADNATCTAVLQNDPTGTMSSSVTVYSGGIVALVK